MSKYIRHFKSNYNGLHGIYEVLGSKDGVVFYRNLESGQGYHRPESEMTEMVQWKSGSYLPRYIEVTDDAVLQLCKARSTELNKELITPKA